MKLKQLLATAPILAHYDVKRKVIVECDASPYGLGACLLHEFEDGSQRPVFYVSRSLTSAESHYSQVEREALAIVFAVKRLHMFLYGRSFVLRTDHRPLLKIFGENSGLPATAVSRLQRWSVVLSEYNYEIEHIKGTSNVTADCLSRLPQKLSQSEEQFVVQAVEDHARDPCEYIPISAADVARASKSDPEISQAMQYLQHGWPTEVGEMIKPYFTYRNELSVESGCLVRGHRTVIPRVFRRSMLRELHSVHVGIVRMKAIARSFFWWPGIDNDIELLAKSCPQCLETSNAPAKDVPHSWVFPSEPFERVHVDYAEFHGQSYLLIVDAFSKWIDVYPVPNTTSLQTIHCLLNFISVYGIPKMIVSDNGPQFTSATFDQFCRENGINHKCTPPYHPASNGQVERIVQELKKALRVRPVGISERVQLSRFLFAYRNTPHSTTHVTPASLLFRKLPTTKFSFLKPSFAEAQRAQQSTPEVPKRSFEPGDSVLILNMRNGTGEKLLKATIQQRIGPVSYAVLYGEQVRHVHADHLRLDSAAASDTHASRFAEPEFSQPCSISSSALDAAAPNSSVSSPEAVLPAVSLPVTSESDPANDSIVSDSVADADVSSSPVSAPVCDSAVPVTRSARERKAPKRLITEI